jgi:UDP-N-acetylglucosamine 2-epimerase (non-hydrolysing)
MSPREPTREGGRSTVPTEELPNAERILDARELLLAGKALAPSDLLAPASSMEPSRRLRVLTVIGTRPEAIKLAAVVLALQARSDLVDSTVCRTSQHRSLVDNVLAAFSLVPEHDLDVMTSSQTISGVAARVLDGVENVLRLEKPDWVVVEGDTTSVLAAGLAAFHAGVRLAHVEAGLRTHDLQHPFPEEANRRIVTLLASIHFAPTETARDNLLAEGIAPDRVAVTGNSGLDALRLACEGGLGELASPVQAAKGERILLVTVHRRESFGRDLRSICEAIAQIATRRGTSVRIVFPVHPNPNVEGPVTSRLAGIGNVTLLKPLPYLQMVALLRQSFLVLTDSGGIQEEAPMLGKPVLVMRETTERYEAVEAGAAIVVGRDTDSIVNQTLALLDDPVRYRQMAVPRSIFGDGHAAERIVDALIADSAV